MLQAQDVASQWLDIDTTSKWKRFPYKKELIDLTLDPQNTASIKHELLVNYDTGTQEWIAVNACYSGSIKVFEVLKSQRVLSDAYFASIASENIELVKHISKYAGKIQGNHIAAAFTTKSVEIIDYLINTYMTYDKGPVTDNVVKSIKHNVLYGGTGETFKRFLELDETNGIVPFNVDDARLGISNGDFELAKMLITTIGIPEHLLAYNPASNNWRFFITAVASGNFETCQFMMNIKGSVDVEGWMKSETDPSGFREEMIKAIRTGDNLDMFKFVMQYRDISTTVWNGMSDHIMSPKIIWYMLENSLGTVPPDSRDILNYLCNYAENRDNEWGVIKKIIYRLTREGHKLNEDDLSINMMGDDGGGYTVASLLPTNDFFKKLGIDSHSRWTPS